MKLFQTKPTMLLTLCIYLAVTFVMSAEAASFDCGKASQDVEKNICANEEISALDEQLSAAYKKALIDAPKPASFKKEQQAWLQARDKACYLLDGHGEWTSISNMPDETCLMDLYKDRISTLEYESTRPKGERQKAWSIEFPLSMASPVGNRFEIHPMHKSDRNLGHGYAICEAMVRWANINQDEMTCPAEVVNTMPGMKDVEWQPLNPKSYETLIFKFYLLGKLADVRRPASFGWEIYSKGNKSDKWPSKNVQEDLRNKVKKDIASGLKMWAFHGNMLFGWGMEPHETTVIRLESAKNHCDWDEAKPATSAFAFVTSDLKELDPYVSSTNHLTFGGRMLKRYKGRIYFINASEIARWAIERSYGITMCEISENPTYWRNK